VAEPAVAGRRRRHKRFGRGWRVDDVGSVGDAWLAAEDRDGDVRRHDLRCQRAGWHAGPGEARLPYWRNCLRAKRCVHPCERVRHAGNSLDSALPCEAPSCCAAGRWRSVPSALRGAVTARVPKPERHASSRQSVRSATPREATEKGLRSAEVRLPIRIILHDVPGMRQEQTSYTVIHAASGPRPGPLQSTGGRPGSGPVARTRNCCTGDPAPIQTWNSSLRRRKAR